MLRPALAPVACCMVSVAVLTGCAGAPQSLPPATAATAAAMAGSQATLYFGGDILTMAGTTPEYVEALEAGRLADLVILERNPLEVDPATIKDIRVVQTIKEGVVVFTLDSSAVAAAPRPAPGHVCNGEMLPGEAMTAEARDTFGLLLAAAGVR